MDSLTKQTNHLTAEILSRMTVQLMESEKMTFIQAQRFAISCIFTEFNVNLSIEQIEKIMNLLTPEQLDQVNTRLDEKQVTWY